MLKQLSILGAILTCANAYYDHAPATNEPYYAGNYGDIAAAHPIASVIDPHRGRSSGGGGGGSSSSSLYNRAYPGNLLGGLSSSSHAGKIIKATYPGAVDKSPSYAVTNPTGYPLGYEYPQHGPAAATDYAHRPSAIWTHPYRHQHHHRYAGIGGTGGIARIAPAPVPYNHAPVGNHPQSRYYAAVTETGPAAATYAHSYPISGSPLVAIPSYASSRHYHPVAIGNGIEKIPHHPSVSHMGYQSHEADESYAW